MKTDPANDPADLLLLRQGEDLALTRLMARWERPLFAFAWRYVQNAADARDLAVETFVRLHQQRARLREDTNVAAWLFTTLGNLCHNHHRWRRRHPALSLEEFADGETGVVHEAATATELTPERALEHDEGLAALAAAIGNLPHDLRVTLLLHYYEGLSYREVAGIAGCSERGVETRLYRARQQLREELGTQLQELARL